VDLAQLLLELQYTRVRTSRFTIASPRRFSLDADTGDLGEIDRVCVPIAPSLSPAHG
jgi:hypothetical protein